MVITVPIIAVLFVSAIGLAAETNEKLLIIHADDVGMCHSVNDATIEAMALGAVSSASIMVPCPWFPEIAAHCREHPDRDMGIHITLTSEWKYYRWRPVTPVDQVPGLVDGDGFMWDSVEQVARHASGEEVEKEIRAQVQRAIDYGIKPTHMDTHMGTVYAKPEFFAAYCKVALEFGIPPMIVSPDAEYVRRAFDDSSIALLKETLERFARGMPMLDQLYQLSTGGEIAGLEPRRRKYEEIIANLQPGVNQIIIHLGLDRPEMRAITGSWKARYNDFLIFNDPEMKRFIEDHGVKLIGWRDVR